MNVHPFGTRSAHEQAPRFMSVKQVADYLHLNEKKIYALVRERKIPATKVTGKWVFPRVLVDRWLLETSHGGLLTDRLVIAGGDDPLLHCVVLDLAERFGARALIGYAPTGTQLGLGLLAGLRADVSCLHWGPDSESGLRHPALLQQYDAHRNWVLIRACRREQGLLVRPELLTRYPEPAELLAAPLRWAVGPAGAGSRRYLQEFLARQGVSEDQIDVAATARSEREAACLILRGEADIAAGVQATATETGLGFLALGWEAFDFVLSRGVYFRSLFQSLLEHLRAPDTLARARALGGYDLRPAGELVWGMD